MVTRDLRPHPPGGLWATIGSNPTPALAVVVVLLFVASLAVGPVAISPVDIVASLVGQGSEAHNLIVQEIRLPRAILGLLIGSTLSLAGASMQGLLRSPLAAPTLFGAPAVAGLAAVLVIALGLTDALSPALVIAATAGALASVAVIVLLTGPRSSILVMILAGLAISTLAAGGIALTLNLIADDETTVEVAFWLLGSLENRGMQHVAMALPFMAVSWILLVWDRPALRTLALGEDAAASLGIPMFQVRIRVVLGVAAGVGAAVAVAGIIGFVGLIAPFLVRPIVRHDPGRLLLPSALAGAALLLAADIAVRAIPASPEIKVGVVTALIGGPMFLAMIFNRRRQLVETPS